MTIFGYLIKKLEGTFFTKISIPINTERYKEALGCKCVSYMCRYVLFIKLRWRAKNHFMQKRRTKQARERQNAFSQNQHTYS